MAHEIHQALYGYSDGHGLLAASQRLEPRATRELRTFTDMAFDGASSRYLTCLPVEALRQQAFVRTWPAPESSRPGSVWSHALFVDFVDLGEIQNLRGLLSLFRYPQSGAHSKHQLEPYERPIKLSEVSRSRTDGAPCELADDLLILWAAYGHEPPSIVRATDPAAIEMSLIRLWEQQWPRLRRSFSFRTRYRVSTQQAVAFDVQVVERLARDQEGVELPQLVPGWVERLARDLAEPDKELRTFLRRYGAECAHGRAELAPLVEIQELLAVGKRTKVPPRVWAAFPDGRQMRALKRALFGDAHDNSGLWRAPEQERLKFVLEASPPTAADFEDLDVRQRLDVLWREKPNQAAKVVADAYPHTSGPAEELIAASTAEHAPSDEIAVLAEQQPALALAALRERPGLLSAPELWTGPQAAREMVAELFSKSDPGVREEVLLDLLHHDRIDAGRGLVEQEPQLWWLALRSEAERVEASPRLLEQGGERLRRLLDASGPAAVGSIPKQLKGSAVLRLLAVTLPPRAGLWRQASSQQWVDVAPDLVAIEPENLRLRALVVLLSVTRLAGTPAARRRLWLAAFAPLHAALVHEELDPSDWEALDALLPRSRTGDRADRLRRGVVDVIARDKWRPQDARAIIAGAHPFESLALDTLQSMSKKRKGWLRGMIDQLIP